MASPRLVSIGYEGRSVDELVEELVACDVDVLVDVRLTPLSRKPGLSKRRLAQHLEAAGIQYLHLKALGNPKHNREPFREGRAADGCAFFERLLNSPEPQTALAQIVDLSAHLTVALLCFERDHERCHRQVVTAQVSELSWPAAPQVVYA